MVVGRRGGEDDVDDALMRTRRRSRPLLFFFNQHSIRLDCSLLLAPSSSSCQSSMRQALKNRQTGGRPLSDSISSSGHDSRPRPTTTVAILILYLLSSIFYYIYAVNVDSLRPIPVAGLLFLSLVGLSTRHYPCWTRAYAGQAQSFAQHHSSREQALVPSMGASTPPYTS